LVIQKTKSSIRYVRYLNDLNDASFVLEEIQKRGDLTEFAYKYGIVIQPSITSEKDKIFLSADLFNANNFFNAFVAWWKSKVIK
jgi:hypothetical protein